MDSSIPQVCVGPRGGPGTVSCIGVKVTQMGTLFVCRVPTVNTLSQTLLGFLSLESLPFLFPDCGTPPSSSQKMTPHSLKFFALTLSLISLPSRKHVFLWYLSYYVLYSRQCLQLRIFKTLSCKLLINRGHISFIF